jgi:hypothetical protein
MGYLRAPGRNPEQNEQLVEEQHRIERERVAEAHLADEAHPTWWQRILRRLRHRKPGSEG